MGLDNGIILHTKTKISAPKELKGRLSDFSIGEDEYQYDICYWRKCWNIRRGVWQALNTAPDYVYIDSLTIDEIKQIWKVIYDLNARDVWDDGGYTIWSYDEIHDQLDYDLLSLEWLISYLREHPDARAEFYDSY